MNDRIYLLDGSELEPLEEKPYNSEKVLQELLAKYPRLLAGEQINSEQPRKWLLVTREMRVPDEEGGTGRWSLDHLFLDQEAIPTLVEIKRSTDTRIRREVVGQLLDYAASAVVYWPLEDIRAKFEAQCEAENKNPDAVLGEHLDAEQEFDEFWLRVKTNLQAGRIRMVFVADVIPPELRRVVEFLNQQMDPAEVLALEIKQFEGQGKRTLVPRVFGQTEQAKVKKTGSAKRSAKHAPLFGHSVSAVIRWMGKEGFDFDKAKRALANLGVNVQDSTIKTKLWQPLASDANYIQPADLTAEQASEVNKAAGQVPIGS